MGGQRIGALALAMTLCGSPAAGQTVTPAERSAIDPDTVQGPPMPEAPREFQLAGRVAWQLWGGDAGRSAPDDGPVFGVSVERLVLPYLSLRFSGFYGETTIAGGDEEVEVNQWIADIAVLGRLRVEPLASAGVTPYAGVSGGAVVHDPIDADLITRSQTALGFGAGIEIDLARRIGIHVDWRHLFVQLETISDPRDRSAVEIESGRIGGGLFWRF